MKYESGEEEIVGARMDVTAARKAQDALHTAQTELAHVTRVTTPEGMGIGLSICRSIIEQHRGRIWTTRNSGAGSTFQFTLPAGGETAP